MAAWKPSAYRLAPWQKQIQRILMIMLATFAVSAVALIYLSISERMTDVKLRIEDLQVKRSSFSRSIADLTTDEGMLTSYKSMQSRAESAGFTVIDFTDNSQYEYVIIDGYTGTGINSVENFAELPISGTVSLIRPEFTESLQEWLYKRITTGIESYEVTN